MVTQWIARTMRPLMPGVIHRIKYENSNFKDLSGIW